MRKEMLENSFDFSIRLIELCKYLQETGKAFPLSERLLLCSVSISTSLRLCEHIDVKEQAEQRLEALRLSMECAYILDLMAKTGYLTEAQSRPIREDCNRLQQLIAEGSKNKKIPQRMVL